MFTPPEVICTLPRTEPPVQSDPSDRVREELSHAFGSPFSLADGATGEPFGNGGVSLCDLSNRCEVLREVARRGRCEFLDEEGPLLLLAIPFAVAGASRVAAAAFLTRLPCPEDDLAGAAARLGLRLEVLDGWLVQQTVWAPPALERMGTMAIEAINVLQRIAALQSETQNLLANTASTCEKISLPASLGLLSDIDDGNLELYRQQSELFAGIVRSLTAAIDAKDSYTCGHSDRVARISVCLAKEMGCDDAARERLYLAGLLHDIGKIGIDDRILRKPDKLTDIEYAHIRTHANIGHKILSGLGRMDDILPAILGHHEAWDGSGYPQKLKATDIPLFARIVAVADAFDAMASDRPYRKGMDVQKIDAILRSGAGRQWDPDIIEAYFRVHDEVREVLC